MVQLLHLSVISIFPTNVLLIEVERVAKRMLTSYVIVSRLGGGEMK